MIYRKKGAGQEAHPPSPRLWRAGGAPAVAEAMAARGRGAQGARSAYRLPATKTAGKQAIITARQPSKQTAARDGAAGQMGKRYEVEGVRYRV